MTITYKLLCTSSLLTIGTNTATTTFKVYMIWVEPEAIANFEFPIEVIEDFPKTFNDWNTGPNISAKYTMVYELLQSDGSAIT